MKLYSASEYTPRRYCTKISKIRSFNKTNTEPTMKKALYTEPRHKYRACWRDRMLAKFGQKTSTFTYFHYDLTYSDLIQPISVSPNTNTG